MKRLMLVLVAAALSGAGYGQVVAVQNDRNNSVYLCDASPITIAASGVAAENVSVTTDNGTLSGTNGHYLLHPDHTGTATITVNNKRAGGQKIGVSELKVISYPAVSMLAAKTGGAIPKPNLCAQLAPVSVAGEGSAEYRFVLQSFTVTVRREGHDIFMRQLADAAGAGLDGATKDFFKTLENNDVVLFTDMRIKDCDGKTIRNSPSMEFIVEDAGKN